MCRGRCQTSGVLPDFDADIDADTAGATHPALVLPAVQLAGRIQHTLVGQAVTDRQVREHVAETVDHGFDAAIVPPCWVSVARSELRGAAARIGSIPSPRRWTGPAARFGGLDACPLPGDCGRR